MDMSVTEHVAKTPRHKTFYLAAGPASGPLVILCHGWPELSASWRHTLPALGSLGFRVVAPDMRGYGRSDVYATHEAYALKEVVADMLDLLSALGRQRAVWVGHDWGAPVVWSIASHHPEVCAGVAGLCVPYWTLERGLDHVIDMVDRKLYPAEKFPAGQWEYMKFYEEHFSVATRQHEKNVLNTIKAIFRAGQPEALTQPSMTAFARIMGGWFGGSDSEAPDLPLDPAVVSEEDLSKYVSALERNGFFGPNSYYMNHAANATYAASAANGGRLSMPCLFVAAEFDSVCTPNLGAHMSAHCDNFDIASVKSGHWMAQEKPAELNAALVRWLCTSMREYWPGAGADSRHTSRL